MKRESKLEMARRLRREANAEQSLEKAEQLRKVLGTLNGRERWHYNATRSEDVPSN